MLHLVGKGTNSATMPLTVPVLRVLEACRAERTEGPLVLRPLSGKPIDRRDCYRMVIRIAQVAGIRRHISPHSLRHGAITPPPPGTPSSSSLNRITRASCPANVLSRLEQRRGLPRRDRVSDTTNGDGFGMACACRLSSITE